MLGYSEPELLQRTWPELTHPEDLAFRMRTIERLLRQIRRPAWRWKNATFTGLEV